jgi:hypothetical protein
MHGSRAFKPFIRLVVNALPLLLFFLGRVAFLVSFIGDVDRDEIVVEQADDLFVRERTAPEIGGAPSAAADVHLPHVAEQEDRSFLLLGQPLGQPNT